MLFQQRAAAQVALAFLLSLGTAPAAESIYKTLREAGLTDSFLVENLVLRRDGGIVTLKSGTIFFTPPVLGRDTLAVFVGEGEFTFDPALPVEKAHLKL